MQGEFYILQTSEDWYQLRVVRTHFCVACGSEVTPLLNTVYKYVRKFKSAERMYKALNDLSYGGRVPPLEYDRVNELYLSGEGLVHSEDLKRTIAQAIEDNRQDTPYNNTKKKVKTTLIKRTTSPAPLTQEDTPVKTCGKKIRPLKVKRTI